MEEASSAYHDNSVNIQRTPEHGQRKTVDGGILLVIEAKGSWLHAGYHLTGATAGPALLSLPYAFALVGWVPGVLALLLGAGISFYSYYILITIVEHFESQGKRFVCFRSLADHIMGKRWSLFFIAPLQFVICYVTVIAAVLVGGVCMKEIYMLYNPDGPLKLYQFISLFGVMTAVLAQTPSFHSLRHVNFLSILLCLGYSLCATCGSIIGGLSADASAKVYTVKGDLIHKTFGVFGSLAIIATSFGNPIIVEIQGTVSRPARRKMIKGLLLCYSVVVLTFLSVSVSGYWAFGNAAQSNIFDNMASKNGTLVVPRRLLVMAYAFVFLQLIAVSVVYLQPAFDVLETHVADVNKGRYSIRNLAPRVVGRTFFVGSASFFAAMLPFFGDINALMGALGYTPLVFVFPIIFSIIVYRPSKMGFTYWFHVLLIVCFSILTVLGSLAAVGQLSLDAHKYRLFADNIMSM
ncbi:hypothetical protein KP509_23G048400 [Ceratopteris richardii]|uniref:Amino acid transporter transmembrane domain-containing protein n=1 Tax=Ceratopteris richardii TaxID=49495 RepID=A0A8T2S2J0_CERRI|nr:hypothetical protein KP509_23G048400 [Ceratopteris richardii]